MKCRRLPTISLGAILFRLLTKIFSQDGKKTFWDGLMVLLNVNVSLNSFFYDPQTVCKKLLQ